MAVATSSGIGFHDLPGEVRNMIYHLFFEMLLAPTAPTVQMRLPINYSKIKYTPSDTLASIAALFLTSHQISKEARGLYYAFYFQRRNYILRSRESIYSFSRVPNTWAHTLHQLHLTAEGVTQGRKILNPVKVALVKAALAKQDNWSTHSEACRLSLSNFVSRWRWNTFGREFDAELNVAGLPITLRVSCDGDKFDLKFTGPLGKLDWTMIPAMRYTEEYGREQSKARRARLLRDSHGFIPLRQMPTELSDIKPFVEKTNAGHGVVTEVAEELVKAMGLELPEGRTWSISLT